jgi:hypothetical protein
LTVAAPLTFRFSFLEGLWGATKIFPAIHRRRSDERRRAVRTDRQVLGIFEAMSTDGAVRAYDDPSELEVTEDPSGRSGRSDTH